MTLLPLNITELDEGNHFAVCIQVSNGTLGRDISLRVIGSTISGRSIRFHQFSSFELAIVGEDSPEIPDFIVSNGGLVDFASGVTTGYVGCVNVSTEDNILETNETYQFRIAPVTKIIRVTGEPVKVTIIDNDSKSK